MYTLESGNMNQANEALMQRASESAWDATVTNILKIPDSNDTGCKSDLGIWIFERINYSRSSEYIPYSADTSSTKRCPYGTMFVQLNDRSQQAHDHEGVRCLLRKWHFFRTPIAQVDTQKGNYRFARDIGQPSRAAYHFGCIYDVSRLQCRAIQSACKGSYCGPASKGGGSTDE
jgi:hypothetical protein